MNAVLPGVMSGVRNITTKHSNSGNEMQPWSQANYELSSREADCPGAFHHLLRLPLLPQLLLFLACHQQEGTDT